METATNCPQDYSHVLSASNIHSLLYAHGSMQ